LTFRPPHREPPGDCQAESLRTAGRAAGRQLAAAVQHQHPEPEKLVAYAEEQLDKAAREAIVDHLAACPECVGMLRDLGAWDSLGRDPASPAADPKRASESWRKLKSQLAAEAAQVGEGAAELAPVVSLEGRASARQRESVDPPPADSGGPQSAGGRSQGGASERSSAKPRFDAWLLAAAVVVALGGAWLLAGSLRQGLVPAAQVNVAVATLDPQRAIRGADDVTEIVLPVGSEDLTLILATNFVLPGTDFDVRVEAATGIIAWRATGLRQRDDGTFALRLPSGELSAGEYRLRIRSATPGAPRETFAFRLRAGTP